jgi:thioredoxin 1
MAVTSGYSPDAPARDDVERWTGAAVLEFGTDWCGICRAAQPAIRAGLAGREGLRHVKVEDGSGRPLGRSFRVKLWPTLVFLRDGKEVARVVRPASAEEVADAAQRAAVSQVAP